MFFRKKTHRYNLLKNVRVELSTMKVERKYVRLASGKSNVIFWEQVDYKTTHKLKVMRPCPPEALISLLKLAF